MPDVILQFRKSVDIFQLCFHITVSPMAVTADQIMS